MTAHDRRSDPDPSSALHLLENSPYTPLCSRGHGKLRTTPDQSSVVGLGLECPRCGERREVHVDMLRKMLAHSTRHPAPDPDDDTAVIAAIRVVPDAVVPPPAPAGTPVAAAPPPPPAPAPVLPNARGLRPDATIRTTGWLQLGRYPISSGVFAALAGLSLGTLLLPWNLALPPLMGALGYVLWKVATVWMWPSSSVVNRGEVRAGDLRPGMCVRIYGPIGPVGVIHDVSPGRRDRVRLHFGSDNYRYVPADESCHVVELRT